MNNVSTVDIFCPACTALFVQLSRHSKWHNFTSAALCGTIPKQNKLEKLLAKMENGMLVDLRGPGGTRDRLLFTCQATVPALVILMIIASCSRPTADMPLPRVGIFDELFSGPVTDTANRQSGQRSDGQPKVQREQPRTSASRKVATVHAPKATGTPSRPASKKANTSRRLDARGEKLFQEFLEWQRQREQP